MSLSWSFEIFDKLSGPAHAMADALTSVESKLTTVSDKLHEAELAVSKNKLGAIKDPLEKAAASLRIERDELQHSKEVHERTGEAVKGFFEKLRHGFELVYFGKEVIGSITEKVSELGSEILGNIAFKQNSLIALGALAGGRDKAVEIFEEVEDFAWKTGQNVQQAMSQTKDLLSAGFSVGDIGVLRQAIGDLGVVDPGKAAALTSVIADIGRQGFLAGRQIMGLKGLINTDELWKNLAGRFHMPVDMLKQLQGRGFAARDAVKSIVDVLSKTVSHGAVGSLLERQAQTIPSLIERVKEIPERIFSALSSVDQGTGGVFASALEHIAEAFDPNGETGQRIIGHIKFLVDRIADAFGIGGKGGFLEELAGPNGIAKVEELFNSVEKSIERALPAIRVFAKLIEGSLDLLGRFAALSSGGLADALMGSKSTLGSASASDQRSMAEATLADPNASDLAREKARKALGMSVPVLPPVGGARNSAVTNAPVFAPQIHFNGPVAESDKDAIAQKVHEQLSPLSFQFEQYALQGGYAPAGSQ